MSTSGSHPQSLLRTDTLNALADSRRRRILAVLDQTSPVHERELSALVAAFEDGKRPADVDGQRTKQVRTDLQHIQLPALTDANLVLWNREEALVTETVERVLPRNGFEFLIDADSDNWDHILDCLANERRRAILTILRTHDGWIAKEQLARDVTAVESAQARPSPRTPGGQLPPTHRDVLRSLHHIHLPKLDEAGLIERGPDKTVSYQGRQDGSIEDTLRLFLTEAQ